MATMDCQTAMSILASCVLFGIVMLTVVLHYVLQRYTSEEIELDINDADGISAVVTTTEITYLPKEIGTNVTNVSFNIFSHNSHVPYTVYVCDWQFELEVIFYVFSGSTC